MTVFVAYSTVYMTKNCFSSAMAAIVSEGVMTKSQTSVIVAVFWLVYAPCQVLGGRAADRYPPSVTVVIGFLGAAIANAVIYFNSRNYVVMLITWGLNAAVQFGIWPSVFKIISTKLCEEIRVKCLFLITFTSSVGLMMGYTLSSVVPKWEDNFILSAFALVVIAVLFMVVYHSAETKMVDEKIEIKHHPDHIPVKHETVGSLIKRSGILLIAVAAFLQSAVIMGPKSMAPTMLMESYESVPAALANRLNVIIIAVGIVGLIISKLLYPKYIKNEVVGLVIMTAACTPFIVSTIGVGKLDLLVLTGSLSLGILFITGASVFSNSYIPSKFNRYGQGATMAGIMNCMCAFGNMCATYMFAAIADGFGWTASAVTWSVMTVIALILYVIAIPVWRRFCKEL